MQAEAGGEANPSLCGVVAAGACTLLVYFLQISEYERTSALVAVGHATWGTVVPGADYTLLSHYAATDPPLHAVAPTSCQICQLHEVLVPAGPYASLVHEVEEEYGTAEGSHVGRRVE